MKVNITKKEFRLLVEMLYLSDWMMHSHSVDARYKEHEELKKKFLSHYKEMEAEDIIEYSKESDDYYEVNEYDEYIHNKFIENYDTETFWDELIDRLAERDVIREIGQEKYLSLEGIERVMKVEEVRERYANEFAMHGLENINVEYAKLIRN
ncbi:MAG: hypothetical protein SFW66_10755 [Gammaproteobacteria bacterium]|nr:hypothetical protein [Gammaproteobacteria bacterium]